MPRAKAPPRVKGPYSERGGARFRIRICAETGYRDLYSATKNEALAGIREAARELPASTKGRSLGEVLDCHINDKVQRGLCNARSAEEHRAQLCSLAKLVELAGRTLEQKA